ncbi:MAG: trypsin-like peptidase domain-containing protein [Verrucomicrobiota bacterium]
MRTPIIRGLTLLSISLLALTGCTNKKDKTRIKELEAEIETGTTEFTATLAEREKDIAEKDELSRTAQSESAQKIQQLTLERDQATQELTTLKAETVRTEAARVARLPKDASSPGHADYDPTKEPKITNAITTLTGDKSSGTGFVVATEGKVYLYTAAHILAGNNRFSIANNTGLKYAKFGAFEMAEGTDFVRLELLDGADAPALQLAADTVKVTSATDIIGLGVSSGTISGERGKALGQKVDSIDVDPSLTQGKSGGPLLDATSGKVLGIIVKQAPEAVDPAAPGSPSGPGVIVATTLPSEIPCNAYRLNRKLEWKAVPIANFLAETKRISDFDRLTRVGQVLTVLSPAANGLIGINTTVSGGMTALAILNDARDIPVAGEILKVHAGLAAKKARTSDVDLKKQFASLVSSVVGLMQRGDAGFEPAKFTTYNRRFAEASLKWRKDVKQRLQGTGSALDAPAGK